VFVGRWVREPSPVRQRSGDLRINTPVSIPGGPEFNFNQYLVVDDEPLVFHTGPRRMFPLVREAIERVMRIDRLRYVTLSHFEADECGALNEFLAAAPRAIPVCGQDAYYRI
jgi:flavorubredoxin